MSEARFISAAFADLREAFDWYESQREGLGADFLDAIDSAIANALKNPAAYPLVYRDVRRILVRRFPYGVYYRVLDEEILVIAVMHAAQHPRFHMERE
ncbi:MAG: type II toxin-antitoxin system RelE/ParE family toxin [Coriobacteriia bacterium]